MKVKFTSTFNLTDLELEAIAHRIDGNGAHDEPTGRKATRQEVLDRFLFWIETEVSESRMTLEDAQERFPKE
jgi:hypothetical protein